MSLILQCPSLRLRRESACPQRSELRANAVDSRRANAVILVAATEVPDLQPALLPGWHAWLETSVEKVVVHVDEAKHAETS